MKIKLALLIFFLFIISINAQIYTPNGVIQGTSINNNVGIGTASPAGKLDISVGSINSFSPTTQIDGSISIGNAASGTFVPYVMGKSTNGVGLFLTALTSDTSAVPDMALNVRKTDNNDYTTLTSTAFRFSRFGTVLVDILRNGNVGIGGQASILNKFEVKVPTSTGSSGVDGIAVHDGAVNRMTVSLGINTAGEYSWIQSSKGGVGSKNLSINPYGGNVGIGTTSAPIAKLHVVDAAGGFFFDGSNTTYNRFKSTAVAPGTPKPLLISAQLSGTTPDIYVNTSGNVGLGTMNPTSMLTVAGNINSREVKVTVDAGADFVFDNNYNLPSLDVVDKYIIENKHLPEIASADEMKKEGINLSEMNIKLLQKIEELTLYVIEQSKEIKALKKENESFKTLSERFLKIENQLENKK
jgi:hypothetical protein